MKKKNKEGFGRVHWISYGLMIGFFLAGPGEIIGLLIMRRDLDFTARDWTVITVSFVATIICGLICWKTRHKPSEENENHKQEG